ncbi:uncharacterized mitochondrial protein AtMg00810-like [Benincasa hispida]|uniref:uncharacterized mitochondrial protein AtMg00810-like n=1 Tax=Benincasa hispida TaxID=102211 RepID=UPI0018FF35D2|nr:uncharacterized mitochondrial protein AtMg00810-like [Benincasa hispida]
MKTLDVQFALKDLGKLHYILGIQVYYTESGLLMNQSKYMDDLLHKLHMTDVKPMPSSSAVKRVLWYVNGTKHFGIYFQPSPTLTVSAYSDADWASNLDDRKSVAAYCTFVGNNIVS